MPSSLGTRSEDGQGCLWPLAVPAARPFVLGDAHGAEPNRQAHRTQATFKGHLCLRNEAGAVP